ncbi:hypothetical protein NDU88_003935, partial [Pleurodeles waltl]
FFFFFCNFKVNLKAHYRSLKIKQEEKLSFIFSILDYSVIMNNICGNPPPPFLNSANEATMKWEKWFRHFKNYMLAINGDTFESHRKKALLLNLIGLEAEDIFEHLPPVLPPSGTDARDYDCFSE